MAQTMMVRGRLFAAVLVLAFALAACGNGDDVADTDATPDSDATEPAGEAAAQVEVTGVDYAFEGVPASVEAGTQLTFANASEAEFHEMVVFRIDDDEERSIEELLALPDEEAQEVAHFRGVAVSMPGGEALYPEGDIVLEESGRYALVCFVPVGADPEVIAEAMENEEGTEGPPDMGDGPPHFTQGMWAEFSVS